MFVKLISKRLYVKGTGHDTLGCVISHSKPYNTQLANFVILDMIFAGLYSKYLGVGTVVPFQAKALPTQWANRHVAKGTT